MQLYEGLEMSQDLWFKTLLRDCSEKVTFSFGLSQSLR